MNASNFNGIFNLTMPGSSLVLLDQPMIDGSHEETRIAEWWRSCSQNLIEDSTAFDEFLIEVLYNGRKIHDIYILNHDRNEAVMSFNQHFLATLSRLVVDHHLMNILKNREIQH